MSFWQKYLTLLLILFLLELDYVLKICLITKRHLGESKNIGVFKEEGRKKTGRERGVSQRETDRRRDRDSLPPAFPMLGNDSQ